MRIFAEETAPRLTSGSELDTVIVNVSVVSNTFSSLIMTSTQCVVLEINVRVSSGRV